jgi:hypothetical protein
MAAIAMKQMKTRRRTGAVMNFDRVMLLMCGSSVAH